MMTRRMLLRFALVFGLGLAFSAPCAGIAAAGKGPTVFAAASLKDALDSVNKAYEKKSGSAAVISYAATSALAKQIVQGAPADIFISADEAWMDYVEKDGAIDPKTRFDLLANRLVLVAPKDSPVTAEIAQGFDLAGLLGGGRLAMANVDSVPAGKYGKAALISLGVWDGVKDKVAQAQNVRAALALVARGEAPLGIVYKTDAVAEPNVRVVGTFPEATHPKIIYPVAQILGAKNPHAAEFVDFLSSGEAAALFEAQGFTVLKRP